MAELETRLSCCVGGELAAQHGLASAFVADVETSDEADGIFRLSTSLECSQTSQEVDMSRYLAIDHGGTKTEMLIFDERGEVVWRAYDRKLFEAGERRKLKWNQRVRRLCDRAFKEDGLLGFNESIISLNGINTERDRRIAGQYHCGPQQ